MPVIFITAYAGRPDGHHAMKSGAVEFVEKPFNRQTRSTTSNARSRTTPNDAASTTTANPSGQITG